MSNGVEPRHAPPAAAKRAASEARRGRRRTLSIGTADNGKPTSRDRILVYSRGRILVVALGSAAAGHCPQTRRRRSVQRRLATAAAPEAASSEIRIAPSRVRH